MVRISLYSGSLGHKPYLPVSLVAHNFISPLMPLSIWLVAAFNAFIPFMFYIVLHKSWNIPPELAIVQY